MCRVGLSGFFTEIEWGFGINDHLCLSFPQPGVFCGSLWNQGGGCTSVVLLLVREH